MKPFVFGLGQTITPLYLQTLDISQIADGIIWDLSLIQALWNIRQTPLHVIWSRFHLDTQIHLTKLPHWDLSAWPAALHFPNLRLLKSQYNERHSRRGQLTNVKQTGHEKDVGVDPRQFSLSFLSTDSLPNCFLLTGVECQICIQQLEADISGEGLDRGRGENEAKTPLLI